jgi:hypothetical protein
MCSLRIAVRAWFVPLVILAGLAACAAAAPASGKKPSRIAVRHRHARVEAGSITTLAAPRPLRRIISAHARSRRHGGVSVRARRGHLQIVARRHAHGTVALIVRGRGCTRRQCGYRFRMHLRVRVLPHRASPKSTVTSISGLPLGVLEGQSPSLTTEHDGSALLAWSLHDVTPTSATGTVWVAEKHLRSDRWTNVVRVSRSVAGNPNETRVAAGPDGTTAVAWVNRTSEHSATLWVSIRPPGHTWSAPLALSGSGPNADVNTDELSIDQRGDVTAVWYLEPNGEVLSRTWSSSTQEWGQVTALAGVETLGITTAASGEIVVVGDRNPGTYVADSRSPVTGTWLAPVPIWTWNGYEGVPGASGFSPADPIVYAASDGVTVAVWSIVSAPPAGFAASVENRLLASVRSAAGGWSAPTVLDTTSDAGFDYQYQIDGDSDGGVTILAGHELNAEHQAVVAYTSDPGASSWSAATLHSPISTADAFRISSGTGDSVSVSFELRREHISDSHLYMRTRSNGQTTWGSPTLVAPQIAATPVEFGFRTSGSIRLPMGPEMVAYERGTLIVWEESDGLHSAVVRSVEAP